MAEHRHGRGNGRSLRSLRAQGHGVGRHPRPVPEDARAAPAVPRCTAGPIDLGEGATAPRSEPAASGHRARLRGGGAGPAGQRDLLLERLRGGDGPGHGPDHPADGRARAPHRPRPGVAELPLQGARALGRTARGLRRQRVDRLVLRPGPGRPGPRGDLQLPGPGHRPHPRPAPVRLRQVPALGH